MSYVVPVPLDVAIITSLRGGRVDPISKVSIQEHGGIDIGVPMETEVFATASGVVEAASFETNGGNFINIKHDDGRRSAYMHLSEILVVPGQRVKAGQLIALSGNTGARTTGPHLHFEVRKEKTKLDPLDFLPGTFKLSQSLATKLGRPTIKGAGIGLVGLLVIGAAAYGGYRVYKKRRGGR